MQNGRTRQRDEQRRSLAGRRPGGRGEEPLYRNDCNVWIIGRFFREPVSAAIGGYSEAFSDSTIFIKGFVERTSYDTYQDLDATIGGVNTGISTQFSKSISTRFSLFGKIKRFQDSLRSGNSYGGEASLKEKPAQDVWFRQFVEYEKEPC